MCIRWREGRELEFFFGLVFLGMKKKKEELQSGFFKTYTTHAADVLYHGMPCCSCTRNNNLVICNIILQTDVGGVVQGRAWSLSLGGLTFVQYTKIIPNQRHRWPETKMYKEFDTIFWLIFHALSHGVIYFDQSALKSIFCWLIEYLQKSSIYTHLEKNGLIKQVWHAIPDVKALKKFL